MRYILPILLFTMAMASPLLGEGPSQQLAQAITTQLLDFAPGGTIRWDSSYGDLYIEGWDRPQIEITAIKSTHYFKPPSKDRNVERLQTVSVSAERRSPRYVAISTIRQRGASGVAMEYRVYVPRDSQLRIHHRGGTVTVGNVSNNVDASDRDGDILLMLAEDGVYSIDARSKMGHIASDFDGRTMNRYLVGERFVNPISSGSRQIHLRVGFGGITILALPREGQALSTAGGN